MRLLTTPSQTVGPFFSFGLNWEDGPYVVPEGLPGGVWLRGQLLDGAGEPVPDALIETWQANPEGRFEPSRVFRGFGRSGTNAEGRFGLFTVKPGRVPSALEDALEEVGPVLRPQAPHIALAVFARGLLNHVVTRVYFADEPVANAEDALLASLPSARRSTLLAASTGDGYRHDIRLQGERETVFFTF